MKKFILFLSILAIILCASLTLLACGENDKGKAHQHTFGEWIQKSELSCGVDEVLERTCSECGYTERETRQATGLHQYGEWTTITQPTCTATGSATRTCAVCKKTESKTLPINEEHATLKTQIKGASFETPYDELYAIFTAAVQHRDTCLCDLDVTPLLENMFYGKWIDADGNYIGYSYVYENYNNTEGSTWYSTNLKTSQTSGNTYYYYTDHEGDSLVIGYQDKITEDRTPNFVITFGATSISVLNKNNDITYVLASDPDFNKVEKGNAKLAYIYIAKNIFDFKNPATVVVTQCYVDAETKTVYATIQAENTYGAAVNAKYKLYMSGDAYQMVEESHTKSSNIDLSELNERLQAYVSTGG